MAEMPGSAAETEPRSEPSAQNGSRPPLRLGGMALRNGLLIHGPTSWAAAARAPDGQIHAASGPKPTLAPGIAGRIPLLRGPLKLAEGFAVVPIARHRLPEARLPFEDWRVLAAMFAATVATSAIRRRGPATLGSELAAAALGLAPATVALGDSELAAYHGAEHKAIGAYEKGSLDPADATKEHERCGSNIVAPMLILSVAGELLLQKAVERPGPLARAAVALGGVSIAVELFAWAERNPEAAPARALHRAGTDIQRLFATREPTPEQLEVSSVALGEILRIEGMPSGTDSEQA